MKLNKLVAAIGMAFALTAQANSLPVIDAVLTSPPMVPPPIKRDHAAKVVVKMETVEKVMEIADGVEYMFWTFGGSVPGQFLRVREGDEIEFHLSNHPSSKMPHNIDLHAVNGPGGGAAASFTAPGHTSVFNFKALHPGLYVYHCATAPVGMHIANGMYGLILVEPEEGLPEVDKEYYVMQGDFYTKGAYGEQGFQPFDMDKAIKEDADYVLFNGSVGALNGEKSLTANVGETVRLYVGNGGPNLTSSFHVIGEIFDKVNVEGGTLENHNVQTTLVPAGGAAIPGAFPPLAKSDFLNEDTTRAIDVVIHGLKGPIKVNGKTFNSIMPAMSLSDEDTANALTYVLNSWGNNGTVISPDDVKERRDEGKAIIMEGSAH